MGLILLIILILLVFGAVPAWPHSRGWGYWPEGSSKEGARRFRVARPAPLSLPVERRRPSLFHSVDDSRSRLEPGGATGVEVAGRALRGTLRATPEPSRSSGVVLARQPG